MTHSRRKPGESYQSSSNKAQAMMKIVSQIWPENKFRLKRQTYQSNCKMFARRILEIKL